MRGSEIAKQLPECPQSGPYSERAKCLFAREEMVLAAVRAGHYVLNWEPLTIDLPPYRATIWVTSDALRLGEPGDSFRVSVMAKTEQQIADELDSVMLTPKLIDDIQRQARINIDPPVTLGSDVPMSTTSRMLHHHNEVEKRVLHEVFEQYGGEVDPADLLIGNVGKHWVNGRWLDSQPKVDGQPGAINYGWYVSLKYAGAHMAHRRPVTPVDGVAIWQTPGFRHNYFHQDYSQIVRLAARPVMICGPKGLSGFGSIEPCVSGAGCTLPDGSAGEVRCMDIYDVAKDEKLWPLVSHEGKVWMRQPSIPWEQPKGAPSLWGGIKQPPPPPPKDGGGVPLTQPLFAPFEPYPDVFGPAPWLTAPRVALLGAGAAAGWFGLKALRRP